MAAGSPVSARELNGKGATALDESVRLRGERSPWTATTLDVACGMKQARKPKRGANRREAEKAWGRNIARGWQTSRPVDAFR